MSLRDLPRAAASLSLWAFSSLAACSGSDAPPVTLPSGGRAPVAGAAGLPGGGATGAPVGGSLGGGGQSGGGSAGALGSAGSAGSAGSDREPTAGTSGAPAGGSGPASAWPSGAVAAVSLTYDDGLDTHLATVIPALDAHGFKGTFFLSNFEGVDHEWALPNLKDPLRPRHMAWQAALRNGHELADHTVNHPCNSASKAPNYHLTDYNMTRMSAELDDSALRLGRLGVVPPITFAYPCTSDKIGIGTNGQDFSPLIAARFFAARTSDSGVADPDKVNLLHVPLQDAGSKTAAQLRAMVDQAIAAKGWLVVLFHGVGAETACPGLDFNLKGCMINYLTTDAAAHQALVDYLAEKQAQVWVAPFGTVAKTLVKK